VRSFGSGLPEPAAAAGNAFHRRTARRRDATETRNAAKLK